METGRAEGTLSLRRQGKRQEEATTDGRKKRGEKKGDNEKGRTRAILRTMRRWERQRQAQAHPSCIAGCTVNTDTSTTDTPWTTPAKTLFRVYRLRTLATLPGFDVQGVHSSIYSGQTLFQEYR